MPQHFRHTVQVYPHHTDYAGVVWHGAYVNWMEEVRIAYLESQGLRYVEVTELGCDLMVTQMGIEYKRALHMGEQVLWLSTIHPLQGVRLHWDYELRSLNQAILYVTAQVTIVPVNRQTGRIMRKLPPSLDKILKQETAGSR